MSDTRSETRVEVARFGHEVGETLVLVEGAEPGTVDICRVIMKRRVESLEFCGTLHDPWADDAFVTWQNNAANSRVREWQMLARNRAVREYRRAKPARTCEG